MEKNKIEAEEYIRTDRGTIAKIEDVEWDILYRIEDMKPIYKHWVSEKQCYTEYIVKHSKNVIDLIETGDIVRVYMEDDVEADGVYEDTNMFEVVGVTTDGLEVVLLGKGFILEFFPKENIRGIVTHEQIEEMEYRV